MLIAGRSATLMTTGDDIIILTSSFKFRQKAIQKNPVYEKRGTGDKKVRENARSRKKW